MAALLGVLGLVALFVGTHIGLATQPIRSRLIAALGEWGFRWLFFAVAGASFIALMAFYATHQWEGPAGLALGGAPATRAVLMAVAVAGVVLMVASFASYPGSPYEVDRPGTTRPPRGLERVTRHPFMVGIVLFGAAHALLATRLVGTVLMLALAVLGAVGAFHQDRKLARLRGASFREYLAVTSAVPFAAIVAGRQRLVWSELPVGAIVAGLAAAAGLRQVHGGLFAHQGAWVSLSLVGGAAVIMLASWRHDRRVRRGVCGSLSGGSARGGEPA